MDRFCRTCLHSIPKDSLFFQLDGHDPSSVALLIKSQLQACVPEVRVGVIKNPVLCSPCLNDLTSAYKFKSKCLETEKQLLDYVLHADSNTTHVDINLFIKRIASTSDYGSQKNQNDVARQSPSLLKHGFHRGEFLSSKRYKTKCKEDYTIDVQVENGKTIKKAISDNNSAGKFSKHQSNLDSFMSSDIKVVGPFSEFITVDDISASVINGIKKDPLKCPQFTINTILGECIDINDSDVEEIPEILLPSTDDVSLLQLTVNNNQKNVEDPFRTPEDDAVIVGGFVSTQIETLQTAIPSCDNNYIPLIKRKSNKNINLRKSKKKCCNSKNRQIKNNNHIQITNGVINIKEISSRLVSANNKTSPKNKDIARTNAEESTSTAEDFSAFASSINRAKNRFNKNIHSTHRTIAKNNIISDTNALRDASPEECSKDNPIKEEFDIEFSIADEYRTMQVKDELIIKDECEIQHHEVILPEIHSSYPHDAPVDKEATFCNENTMDVEELQLQSTQASTSQQCKCSTVLNRTPDGNLNSEPSYREARRGCYSCAVCSYSCNSESILVAHTKMHANKNSYKYDDLMFCGFTHDDLKIGACLNCKYIKSETFLMWLKPEVVLTKCRLKSGPLFQ